jgi:hypothetical protein
VTGLNQNLNRAFVLFDIDAREQDQSPKPLPEDFGQVLQRPIETPQLTGLGRAFSELFTSAANISVDF